MFGLQIRSVVLFLPAYCLCSNSFKHHSNVPLIQIHPHYLLANFWRKRSPPSTNCQKRPSVKKIVKKDSLSMAASLANWHVAHATIAKAGMYLPPLPEPAHCLNLRRDTCTPCLSTCHLSMPDLTQAAWPILGNVPTLSQAASTCRLWQWRHVPRVSWLDMPPPRGGLFWQFFFTCGLFWQSVGEGGLFCKKCLISSVLILDYANEGVTSEFPPHFIST
jgi:hypothetical protein